LLLLLLLLLLLRDCYCFATPATTARLRDCATAITINTVITATVTIVTAAVIIALLLLRYCYCCAAALLLPPIITNYYSLFYEFTTFPRSKALFYNNRVVITTIESAEA
jgi:hypothetical protein